MILLKSVVISALIVTMFGTTCAGQSPSPYVQEGSIGNGNPAEKSVRLNPFMFLPFSQWVGHNFVFLPRDKDSQHYGYQNVSSGETYDVSNQGVPYNDLVGRVAVVSQVTKIDGYWHMTLKMADNGEFYSTAAYGDTVDDIAPAEDFDKARKLWEGKKLWCKNGVLSTYDADNNKFGAFSFKRFTAVQVMKIVASFDSSAPVRFICKTDDGRIGYEDVHLSDTNIAQVLREYGNFGDVFLTNDPRIDHPWTAAVWQAIESRKLLVGMTTLQAEMAWALPPKVQWKKTATGRVERWYGYKDKSHFVQFLNDKIIAVRQ
jgi:hypothetical protein